MRREQFARLIRFIFAARDNEILCSQLFELLPRFVDLELLGEDAAALLPQMSHHLGQCPERHEVYRALLKTARSEGPTKSREDPKGSSLQTK
jgi:hypothetical protein